MGHSSPFVFSQGEGESVANAFLIEGGFAHSCPHFSVKSDIDFIFRTVLGMRVVFWATEQIKSGRARMLQL